MAQQETKPESVKWKLGAICDVFDRKQFKWVRGEVVGSFTNEEGEWIMVQCDEDHRDFRTIDPDLRQRSLLHEKQLKALREAAVQQPNIEPILKILLSTSSSQGLNEDPASFVVILTKISNLR